MAVASTESAIRPSPGPSTRRAAALIAWAWLPAVIVAAGLPRFVPVFDRWGGDLPPLTAALVPVARLGVGPVAAVGLGLVAVVVALYVGWARADLPGRRAVGFVLAAAGLGGFAVLMAAALGPMLTAPPPSAW